MKKKEKSGGAGFSSKRRKSRVTLWAALGLAALALGSVVLAPSPLFNLTDGEGVQDGKSFQVEGGELRSILSPHRFNLGHISSAYAMAAAFPEAMDQVYCYCRCDRSPFNHKSLKSCFATTHGAG